MKVIKKRIFALLLIFVMMPFSTFVANAEPMDKSILENEDFLMLEALGFIEREELPFLTMRVSRSMFIKLAVKISDAEINEYAANSEGFPFDDVLPEDKKYVYTAYTNGFISKAPDRRFNPDEPVSAAQAAKILTTLLGYGEYAIAKGGFPQGYMRAAMEADIFDGCNIENQESINYATCFKMLRNTLTTVIYESDTITKESITYSQDAQNTILTKYFDIYCAESIVSANEFTSVTYNEGTQKGCVEFGGEIFIDECEVGKKIGCRVQAYYKKDDSDLKRILYFEESKQNQTYVVSSYDIDERTTKTSFAYVENNKLKTLNIKATASLIYNSKFETLTREKLLVDKGLVTLIDNNRDNKIDVICVEDYNQTMHVNAVSSTGIVSALYSNETLNLNNESDDFAFEIIKNGVKITPSEIMSKDVINVAMPTTKSSYYNVKILVQNESYEGAITQMSTDDNLVWVNERSFRASDSMLSKLKLGDEGIFYFDSFEEIINKSEYEKVIYGYLYNIAPASRTVQAEIFTENNRWVIVDFEKNILFNNTKKYPAKDLLTEELLYPNGGDFKPQMVAYYLTDERKISRLFTAVDDTSAVIGTESTAQINNDFRLSYSGAQEPYREYTSSFEVGTYLGENTKIFMIPENSDPNFEEEILVCDASKLVADRTYKDVKIYNRTVSGITSLVSLQKNTDSYVGLGFMVIKDIRYGTDEETGETVYVIRGWQNGIETSISTTDMNTETDVEGFAVNDLSSGDIIQFELSPNNSIRKIYIKYDCSSSAGEIKGTYSFVNANIYNSNNFLSGTVKSCDLPNKIFSVEYSNSKIAAISLSKSVPKVYVYDTEEEVLKLSNEGEIVPGRKIFFSMRYLRPETIIVYD